MLFSFVTLRASAYFLTCLDRLFFINVRTKGAVKVEGLFTIFQVERPLRTHQPHLINPPLNGLQPSGVTVICFSGSLAQEAKSDNKTSWCQIETYHFLLCVF